MANYHLTVPERKFKSWVNSVKEKTNNNKKKETLIFMRITVACECQKHQAWACVLSLFEQWLLF